jgi:hypothetical protein
VVIGFIEFRITYIVTSEVYWNCDASMLDETLQTGLDRRR